MPGKEKMMSKNIQEQIDEYKRKINLIEGDRKAYYESAEWTMKQNKEKIGKLRKENKELHKLKADRLAADEHVVNKGLEDHPKERNALRDKSGNVAILKMDEKVRDRVNVLNNLKYQSTKYQKRLEELQTQHGQMAKDSEDAADTDAGESEEAQRSRNLENRLDKANLKCKEAEHIRKTYVQIKSKLEEEHKTFENTLDEMEQEIRRLQAELKDLQVMRNDALIARDAAKQELEKQEKEVYAERRKRENELQKVRKEAEEKKMQHESFQRRLAARGSLTHDELTPEQKQMLTGEDEQQRITTYEEMFRQIKEATGVSDTQEVVLRFENQGDTQTHLEELKKDNEKAITRYREEKEKLQQDFEEMKYSGEAKLSSGQRMLEEFETHLKEEDVRRDDSQKKLEKSSRILLDVKSGVEHLAEKLKHLKAASSQVQKAKISPSSDEYVLDQLSQCEEKLLKLLEELDQSGKDISELAKQMEEEEFHNTQEFKLPTYNTRIRFPQAQKDNMFDDDEDSGDDEDNIPTRDNLKKQSQQIVDSKTRRRPGKRKKKSKM